MSTAATKTKTFIACRPGMQAAMQAQFVGMEVVVDPTIQADFEFRKRELSGIELIEAQLEEEEKVAADPAQATTLLVPLVRLDENPEEFWARQFNDNREADFLVIRCEPNATWTDVCKVTNQIRPTKSTDYQGYEYINANATAAEIKSRLKNAGIEVYSVSLVFGLALPKL